MSLPSSPVGPRSLRVAFVVLSILIAFPAQTSAQAQTVSLRGFVTRSETGQALPNANVVLRRLDAREPPHGAVADGNGYYRISELSPGRYALRASFVGYRPLRDTLRLTGEQERVTHTIELRSKEQTLEEFVVTDTEPEAGMAGRQTVTPEAIERVPTPSVSGDLTSYLQSQPGIVSVGDRGGQLYIRGGTPDQNLVLMDRMQVYRPFHIVGFYSVFPQELVSNAEVYAGGFPAKYSGRLSSVIDVEMRGGNTERLEGATTVGPFLTGLRVEGPLNDDGLSILTATRFSQIERAAPLILGEEQPLTFNDQFVKVQRVGESSRCSFSGLHTFDRGQIDPEDTDVFRWSNYAFGGRCMGFGSGSPAFAEAGMNFSYARNAVGTRGNPERVARLFDFSTKVDVSRPLGTEDDLRGGLRLHYSRLRYELGEKFAGFRTSDEVIIDVKGYSEALLSLGEDIDVRPGVAVTFPIDFGSSIEPRLRATWRPFGSETREVNAAVGFYRQSLAGISDERDVGSVFTAWVPSSFNRARPSAWHAILGGRQQLGSFDVAVEGYYKTLSNLSVPAFSANAQFTTELLPADGTVWGIDVRGTYEQGPVYAYLGYGLSWTRYKAAGDSFGSWLGSRVQTYHPPHDRRHTFTATVSARLGFATADAQWQIGSGLPYTRPFGFDTYLRQEDFQDRPRSASGVPRILYEKPYRSTLPAYHRLDISLERTVDLGLVDLTAKAGAINVYDRQNLFYFDLFTQRRVNQLPFLPYLAVEIATNR